MKTFTLLFLLIFNTVLSQTKESTIYVTNNKNVLLFFSSPIKQAITGHTNFQFAFDLTNGNKYGIIRGNKGVDSNLHVITANGLVYSFLLKFKEEISVFNHFIKENKAVGNIDGSFEKDQVNSIVNKGIESQTKVLVKPNNGDIKTKEFVQINDTFNDDISPKHEKNKLVKNDRYLNDKYGYMRDRCYYFLYDKPFYKRVYSSNQDIYFYLEEIKYIRNELYIKLRVENKSGVDYDANFVLFSKVAKRKSKNSTSQSLPLTSIYTYKPFKNIPGNESHTAIYVFNKFGLSNKKLLEIEINELKGERNIKLTIPSKDVNNPNK